MGRAGDQRAARLLPADPPGHPRRPVRLHRPRQVSQQHQGQPNIAEQECF